MSEQTMAPQAESRQSTLLLVDDEINILSSLKRLLRPLGHQIVTATSGAEGLEILAKQPVDLIISDMRMPEMDGAQFLKKATAGWPSSIRVLLTGYSDLSSTIDAVNKGSIYRYISKPWDDHDLTMLVQQALKFKHLGDEKNRLERLTQEQNEQLKTFNTTLEKQVEDRTEELRQAMGFLEKANTSLKMQYTTSVKIFANLIELREGIAGEAGVGHARRVADQAHQLGNAMELPDEEIQDILFAALLHDIGKIALPDKLLKTPYDELNADERKEFEKHPLLGQAILVALEPLHAAANLIHAHHEWFNGKGYPKQLHGCQIPIGARILAVIDDYNALLTGALFNYQHSPEEAKEFLQKERNERYDPQIVDSFIQLLESETPTTKILTERCLKSPGLQDGMVLTHDLVTNNGLLLLSKGQPLNDKLILKICQLESAADYDLSFYVDR